MRLCLIFLFGRCNNQCEYNGNEVLMESSRIIPYSNLYDVCFKDITRAQVLSAIRQYFRRTNMSMCLLSEKLPSLERVQKVFHDCLICELNV